MKRFSRIFIMLICILALLSATGCGAGEETAPTALSTEPPVVDIGGMQVELDATELDLTAGGFELDALVTAAESLRQIVRIEAGTMTAQDVLAIQKAFPDVELSYA